MAKLLKIVGRLIGISLEWVLIVLIAFFFAIRTSQFQTYLGDLATNYLSKELKAELRIGKIDIQFLDKLLLKDVFVRDQNGDTLASLNRIEVIVESLDLQANKVTLSNIQLLEGRVGISRDSIKGDYNYWFITDYFDSGSKTKKKKDPLGLVVKSLDISKVNISYDDNRKGYSDYGMDYDHLFFHNVELHAKQFKVGDGSFSFYLAHLSTKERCGFDLKRLRSNCYINQDKGIFLSNVIIHTPKTVVYSSRFNMKMSSLNNVHTFEDSVIFNSIIDSSIVNLHDVSMFATALEGMDQTIVLSGELHNRVKDLSIRNIDLRFGKQSIVRGDFLLPDFRSIKGSKFKESVSYAYVDFTDLTRLKLPKDAAQRYITLDPMIQRLGYVELKRSTFSGTTDQFFVQSKKIASQLGSVRVENGLVFNSLAAGGYAFERTLNSDFDVYVDSFQVGKFVDNSLLGKATGAVFLSGVVGQKDIIRIEKLSGDIKSFGFSNYTYSNIKVENGSYIDNKFEAKIDINDPHLQLSYDGLIDLNDEDHYKFTVAIPKADIGKLKFVKDPNASLETALSIDMHGSTLNTYSGTANLITFEYKEGGKSLTIPSLDFTVKRNGGVDFYTINSNVADIEMAGVVNFNTLPTSINNSLAQILPTYFQTKAYPKKIKATDHFDLKVDVKEANEFLDIFVPGLYIANGTTLVGNFDARTRIQTIQINSSEIAMIEIDPEDSTDVSKSFFSDLTLTQSNQNGIVNASFFSKHAQWNDSLFVSNFDLKINGDSSELKTQLVWNEGIKNPAEFNFLTRFRPNNGVELTVKPSFFSVKEQLWEIMNTSELVFMDKKILIDHLFLERDMQFLAIDGVLSNDPEDDVEVNAIDVHIEEFASIFFPDVDIKGRLNGSLEISTPFTSVAIDGDLSANQVFINNQEIGDISVGGNWDNEQERFFLQGKLLYLQERTFDFGGHFYPLRADNNLDFILNFSEMDIQFVNAFMDPDVLSDISGTIKGNLTVKGKTESPIIDGKLNLFNANVKVGILGVNYKVTKGPLRFDGDNNGIYAELPVKDEEGNDAYIFGQVFHENFENWNMDLDFVFDERLRKRGAPQNRLLVLNTKYKEGEVYYGKAYATGTANINMHDNITEINVTARTEKGTKIDLPMYGSGEISEYDFISFEKDSITNIDDKVNLTGVLLNLNIQPTTDAEVRLIFNALTEDVMVANGNGDLNITADRFGNVFMMGQYTISSGKYNFVMNPIREEFYLKNGGTITWTGNPAEANLNITAYSPVNASLEPLTGGVVGGATTDNNHVVNCLLEVTNTLSKPLINLDIEAPNATESGKSALNRVKASKEELEKQFFSLLLMQKFIPLNNSGIGAGGALGDLVSEQLNAILDKMSSDVKFNVGYSQMSESTQGEMTVGLKSALGEKQNIILKGTFGVASATDASTQNASSSLIGDMSIEYLINDEGTFRATIANESNKKGVLTESDRGDFSQAVGVYYQEEFNKASDSKIISFIIDPFNRKKRRPTRKEKKVPLPDPVPVTVPAPPKEETPSENPNL
ncbi:MAG: translocation/assembly module TamB domain-containing protein [Fluviicola sp.]|nr:translocation/assembly module TamB domain-containing protein [Fluviicola sp.]